MKDIPQASAPVQAENFAFPLGRGTAKRRTVLAVAGLGTALAVAGCTPKTDQNQGRPQIGDQVKVIEGNPTAGGLLGYFAEAKPFDGRKKTEAEIQEQVRKQIQSALQSPNYPVSDAMIVNVRGLNDGVATLAAASGMTEVDSHADTYQLKDGIIRKLVRAASNGDKEVQGEIDKILARNKQLNDTPNDPSAERSKLATERMNAFSKLSDLLNQAKYK